MKKRVPVSINEALVSQYRIKDAPDAELDALALSVRACREAAERALDTTEKVMANRLRTSAANTREARDIGFTLQQSAVSRVDAARKRVLSEIERLESTTSAPPEPRTPSGIAIETEIRSALARMSHEDRARTISEAVAAGQDDVVGAALRGPTILTGLGAAEREARRHQWRLKRFPSEVSRIERLTRATEAADRAAHLLMGFVAELTDDNAVRAAEITDRLAREAVEQARKTAAS